MRIAILHGPRDLRIEERPLERDRLKSDEIHVETQITALKIGTDRGNYEGAEPVPGAPDYPRWVGDSNFGIVRQVGSAVTKYQVGDRVVGNQPHQSEYIARETDSVAKVPAGVDPEDGVYAWLYALSSLCYRKAQFQPGENVAVVGLGVLGLGAVALGPLMGARVVGVGNSPVRLEMAAKMGAHAAVLSGEVDLQARLDEFTSAAGIDLVILTANPWPAYQTAMEIVRPGGRIAIVSLPGRGEAALDFNPLDMKWFYQNGISLIAVSGKAGYLYPGAEPRFNSARECEYVLSLMADGRLAPKQLVTHRFHYTEMATAYEMAYRREKTMLGVIFQWTD
jgi:polar amino acid transport system substrate-binding protein